MRYFPLIPRLKRLYMCSKTAEDMRWHFNREDDKILRHPADGVAWKKFDEKYKEFSANPRSVRLGLASDGFNPYRLMNSNYSTWPVVLIPYNLPPWICNIAKIETYCPLGEEDWHAIDEHFKKKIINVMRDRFVIPIDELYNKAALKHVNKSWRQYKFNLKKDYYKPKEKTLEEMCSTTPPHGISSQNWIKLLKYWDSEKGKSEMLTIWWKWNPNQEDEFA
uniref:Uncharacterized protein n=1 Tax=Chenopodium quinoa TaxID=63459 RepID=A0A803LPR4_CHEQI